MSLLFKSYQFDSGSEGPAFLITAGVHGDEYEPILAAQKLIEIIPPMLKAGKVTIVPVVNESAYRLASRCGEDGVDLARACPGNASGSITQQVGFQVSELIRASDYYIDMHTGGRIFNIFPLAGYMLHSNSKILDEQRRMASVFGLPIIWGTDRHAAGRTISVARDANVPAIYVEYGGPTPVVEEIVDAYISGCLNVLISYSMVIRQDEQKANSTVYFVEDNRLNNGHLQSKMPAPFEGIFLPKIKAGDAVKKGWTWGIISNPVTGEKINITVEENGIALFTHIGGYVQRNQSLGGLLPITAPGKKVFHESA